jgi:hypothetical protein
MLRMGCRDGVGDCNEVCVHDEDSNMLKLALSLRSTCTSRPLAFMTYS